MEYVYIAISILILSIGASVLITFLRQKQTGSGDSGIDYDNVIQKRTVVLSFNLEGYLQHTSPNIGKEHVLSAFKVGEHISDFQYLNNIERYFETCVRSQKPISLKVEEERESEYMRRHDLIFTPLVVEGEVVSVALISQQLESLNKEEMHLSKQKKLEEQRNFALRQIDEIEAQKSELEIAFKKSSKHHIMLQKALRKIEMQKEELEHALETINKQKDALEIANKEISESSKMKEMFLANTSHEIRTPLNAIIGFTNLLLHSKLNSSQQKYLENIKASSNHLLVVINDILDFSKMESGKMTLEQIEFDFKNFIRYTINTLSVKAREKKIDLKYTVSSEVPEFIIGDPVRLNQILMNLLGNAIKFTNGGGLVELYATMGEPVGNKQKILFKVEDNGIGISKTKIKDIFHSFTQGESDTTRKYGGTGLGLSIVKQLIELQGGEITVDSEVDKGTSFTFYILLTEDKIPVKPRIKQKSVKSLKQKSEGATILLVEDNEINRQLAYDTIQAWNPLIHIDIAENGKKCIELLDIKHYDLILMDIQMPEMDGIEATKIIRNLNNEKKNIPIIAMTAHALKNEKTNCLKMGMDDYISKPFDPEELYAKIVYYTPKTDAKPERVTHFEVVKNESVGIPNHTETLFNTESLESIYKHNIEKIVKIVSMCRVSIPDELEELQEAITKQDWDVVKGKAHALKPKLGYLGMYPIQEKAKQMELNCLKESQQEDTGGLLEEIKDYWQNALPEVDAYIANNKS